MINIINVTNSSNTVRSLIYTSLLYNVLDSVSDKLNISNVVPDSSSSLIRKIPIPSWIFISINNKCSI